MTITSTHKPALLLIGHGTRLAEGVAEFQRLTTRLQEALPARLCAAGFLELAKPSLRDAFEDLVRRGAREIVALPAMLLAGGHVKSDIPDELDALRAEYPDNKLTYGVELGVHPNLLQVARERIESCETTFGPGYARQDTLLLVVGRGCSDPDANSNVSKITRLLWEGMGFGWAETAYCAVTPPLVANVLDHIHGLGYRRIVVFPYVLFNGHLIRQIHAAVETYQARHPEVRSMMAPYFSDHPLVVQTFIDRLHQVEAGDNRMNCLLCQYRQPLFDGGHRHETLLAGHRHDSPSQ